MGDDLPPSSHPYLLVLPLDLTTKSYCMKSYKPEYYGPYVTKHQVSRFANHSTVLMSGVMGGSGARSPLMKVFFALAALVIALFLFSAAIEETYISLNETLFLLCTLGAAIFVTKFTSSKSKTDFFAAYGQLMAAIDEENQKIHRSGAYWTVGSYGRWLELHLPQKEAGFGRTATLFSSPQSGGMAYQRSKTAPSPYY